MIFIIFQNTGNMLNCLFHLYKIKQQGTISNNMIKAMPLQFLFKHFHKQVTILTFLLIIFASKFVQIVSTNRKYVIKGAS